MGKISRVFLEYDDDSVAELVFQNFSPQTDKSLQQLILSADNAIPHLGRVAIEH